MDTGLSDINLIDNIPFDTSVLGNDGAILNDSEGRFSDKITYVTIPYVLQDFNAQNLVSYVIDGNQVLPIINQQVLLQDNLLEIEPSLTNDQIAETHTAENPQKDETSKNDTTVDLTNEQTVEIAKNIKIYTCDFCGARFETRKLFNKHQAKHLTEKPFKCPKCPESFNYEYNLIPHLATHDSSNPFCPVCKKRFKRIAGLKAHIWIHQSEDSLFCQICGEEFTSQVLLDAHTQEHKDGTYLKTKTYKCAQCNLKFDSLAVFKAHSKDPSHKSKTIKKAKKRITRREYDKGYSCEFCSKTFAKPSQVARHCRIHTGEKPYTCQICQKAFSQKGSLQIHMFKHNGQKPYKCQYCDSSFSQKGNLQAHIHRLHEVSPDEGRIKCDQCSCLFRNVGSLNIHLMRAHSINESKKRANFEVTLTKGELLTFPKAYDQQEESNTAPTEEVNIQENMDGISMQNFKVDLQQDVPKPKPQAKNHTCDVCQKQFRRASDLARHSKTHAKQLSEITSTVEKEPEPTEFRCPKCDCAFKTNSELETHEEIHIRTDVPFVTNESFFTLDSSKIIISPDGLIEVYQSPLESTQENQATTPKLIQCESKNFKNSDESDFKCKECSKTFSSQSNLKRHLETHSAAYLHCCPLCIKLYRSQSACQKHISATHNVENIKPVKLDVVNQIKTVEKPVEAKTEPLQGVFTDLIKSLQLGQQFMITTQNDVSQPVSSTSSEALFDTDGEQLISLNNEQGFDNAVFLQNETIDVTSQVIDTNIPEILPESNLDKCDVTEMSLDNLVSLGLVQKTTEIPDLELDGKLDDGIIFDENDKIIDNTQDDILININRNDGIFMGSTLVDQQNETRTDFAEGAQNNFTDENLSNHVFQADGKMYAVKQWYASNACYENFNSPEQTEWHCKLRSVDSNLDFTPTGSAEKKKKQNWKRSDVKRLTDEERKAAMMTTPSTYSEKILCDAIMEYERIQNQNCEDVEIKKTKQTVKHRNKCPHCDKSFKKPSDLVRHVRIHTGELPFKCPDCDKSFNVKSTAAVHIRTHTKDVHYKCHICEKLFALPGSLKLHMRLHTGAKPYSCSVCPAKFRTSGHKKAHLISHLRHASQQSQSKIVESDLSHSSKETHEETPKEIISVPDEKAKPAKYVLSMDGLLTLNENHYAANQTIPPVDFFTKAIKNGLITDDLEKSAYTILSMSGSLENENENEDCLNKLLPDLGCETTNEVLVLDKTSQVPAFKTPVVKKIECNFCNKLFTKTVTLDKHVKKFHANQHFECNMCSKKFKRKTEYELHLYEHDIVKEWMCESCSKSFQDEETLRNHECAEDKTVMKPFSLDLSSIVQDLLLLPSPIN